MASDKKGSIHHRHKYVRRVILYIFLGFGDKKFTFASNRMASVFMCSRRETILNKNTTCYLEEKLFIADCFSYDNEIIPSKLRSDS